jgi:DNA ligase-1
MRIDEEHMTLLTNWSERMDCRGWFVSEKFDGCRAFWDGENLWTRGGHRIRAPRWFTATLPAGFRLDGEIWAGRGRLERASNAVRNGHFTRAIRYQVFDAPLVAGSWDVRLAEAGRALRRATNAGTVMFGVIRSFDDLQIRFHRVHGRMGEGIVLRNPAVNTYETGRTKNAVRVKRDPYWGYL